MSLGDPVVAIPIRSDISLPVAAGSLRGTLTVPATGTHWPVAVIHAGSGPTDRDGNPAGGPRNDCLRVLADSLANRGIASVRYDKRGIGQSASLVASESDLTIDQYVGDMAAWLKTLAADSRFTAVSAVGHSEGALIATLAAQKVPVTSLVLLEGVGRPAGDLLMDQLAPSLTRPESLAVKSVIDSLASGRRVDPLPAGIPESLRSLFRASAQPYLISWFRYDPSAELARIPASTRRLAVQGRSDLQVFKADADRIGTVGATQLVWIDSMTHVLRSAGTDPAANAATYSNPALPLSRGLVEAITALLR